MLGLLFALIRNGLVRTDSASISPEGHVTDTASLR
jgi:hypothetical protein